MADAGDLWQGRFFPSALCLILAGAMAYQLGEFLKAHERLHQLQEITAGVALPAFLIVALFAGFGPFGGTLTLGGREAISLLFRVLHALRVVNIITNRSSNWAIVVSDICVSLVGYSFPRSVLCN